jgi:hypothetical protein
MPTTGMPAITISSLERRILRSVGEEIASEPVAQWAEPSLQLCLALLRDIHETAGSMRRLLEGVLANGVEARRFAREYTQFLPLIDEHIHSVEELVGRVSPAKDAASESIEAGLKPIVEEYKAFRDFLAEALSLASEPGRPIDWDRVRAAEEAHARGDSKRYSPKK